MSACDRLRVIVADDHAVVLAKLRVLLEDEFDVLAAVADGASAVAESKRLFPDVVVCDIAMPGMNGFDVARELGRTRPEIKVVFVTVSNDPAYLVEASRIRVLGYVLKTEPSELKPAIRAAAAGERYLASRLREAQWTGGWCSYRL
jgi:DNA-binding NarL/FixJ family response regulator